MRRVPSADAPSAPACEQCREPGHCFPGPCVRWRQRIATRFGAVGQGGCSHGKPWREPCSECERLFHRLELQTLEQHAAYHQQQIERIAGETAWHRTRLAELGGGALAGAPGE